MNDKFINRSSEKRRLTSLIKQESRINIIFSNEGFGKTALLENYLNSLDFDSYIRVSTEDLFTENAPEFYFITRIITETCEKLNINKIKNTGKKFWDKQKSNLSISLNIGPIGIGYTFPQEYRAKIDNLIDAIKLIGKNIYIHIENVQKIDYSSLSYIIKFINETSNVIFFLECSDNVELCNKLKKIFTENKLHFDIMPINKLEWPHVSLVLKNLNIVVNSTLEKEYESLNGNLKKLIFNNSYDTTDVSILDAEQQFILNCIKIMNTNISVSDLHTVVI